jgi:hypothetical protein
MSNDYLTNAYLTDNSVISQIIGAYGNNFTIFLSYNLALRVNFEPLSKFLLTELIKFPYNFNSYISEDVMNNNPKISVPLIYYSSIKRVNEFLSELKKHPFDIQFSGRNNQQYNQEEILKSNVDENTQESIIQRKKKNHMKNNYIVIPPDIALHLTDFNASYLKYPNVDSLYGLEAYIYSIWEDNISVISSQEYLISLDNILQEFHNSCYYIEKTMKASMDYFLDINKKPFESNSDTILEHDINEDIIAESIINTLASLKIINYQLSNTLKSIQEDISYLRREKQENLVNNLSYLSVIMYEFLDRTYKTGEKLKKYVN